MSRENKHFFLEAEDDALVECTTQWLNMYDKNLKKRIVERVVKNEEEDIDVEDDQAEPEEPKIPPPEKVSMEIQTDDSFMSDQKTGSSHLEALRRERSQRRRKMIFNMMTRLQRKNLPHVSIMVRISLELKMIEFFENFQAFCQQLL